MPASQGYHYHVVFKLPDGRQIITSESETRDTKYAKQVRDLRRVARDKGWPCLYSIKRI